jgi:hypothetical protein
VIIYRVTKSYGNFEQDTKFIFNKSKQRFETFNHKGFISNGESADNPGLIIIYMEVANKVRKERTWNINF